MEQKEIAIEISDLLSQNGYSPSIEYSGCCIDVIVELGEKRQKKGLTQGRVRVFWGDNKIEYLGCGECHYDGFEIKRGWTKFNNDLSKLLEIIKKDKKQLLDWHKKIYKL